MKLLYQFYDNSPRIRVRFQQVEARLPADEDESVRIIEAKTEGSVVRLERADADGEWQLVQEFQCDADARAAVFLGFSNLETDDERANVSAPVEQLDNHMIFKFYLGKAGGSDTLRKLEAIRIPHPEGVRFLDLGCNAGFFCGWARDHGASYVLGVDNDPAIISVARKRNPDIAFIDTGWDDLPNTRFDIVICLSAIHYAANQVKLVSDVRDRLSDQGLLLLEGGYVDASTLRRTDIPLVAFREVGDRVRHLTHNFVRNHLLADFNWRVVGPSISQGGDPIPRSVIHATKGTEVSSRPAVETYHLCPLEYASALMVCAGAIQDRQPSSGYIRAIASRSEEGTERAIRQVLADPEALAQFADDVAFAMRGHGRRLTVDFSLGEQITLRLAEVLTNKGIEVEFFNDPVEASDAILRRMEAGVEFAASGTLSETLAYCELNDEKVADLSGHDTHLWRHLLDANVSECHLLNASQDASAALRVTDLRGDIAALSRCTYRYIFLDAPSIESFDYVDDAARFARAIRNSLNPSGSAYVILKTGLAQTEWDVSNRVVLSPIGKLPTSEYLFNSILGKFAVRPLMRVESPCDAEFAITRIFRLTSRRPTLLAIIGRSQSGKTTLARQMKQLPGALHVSNDYLFYDLFHHKSLRSLPFYNPRFDDLVGDGSAEHVGDFFRALETDSELFRDYLRLVLAVIPKDQMTVSLDLDLRQADQIEVLKEFFETAGFSVWIATR